MNNIKPVREEDYQALVTLIGHMCQELSELGKQVDDEELRKKLLDLADQCGGEFFKALLETCARTPEDEAQR